MINLDNIAARIVNKWARFNKFYILQNVIHGVQKQTLKIYVACSMVENK